MHICVQFEGTVVFSQLPSFSEGKKKQTQTCIVQIKLQNKQLQFDNGNNTGRFILKEAAHDLMSKESGFNLYLIKFKKKKKV